MPPSLAVASHPKKPPALPSIDRLQLSHGVLVGESRPRRLLQYSGSGRPVPTPTPAGTATVFTTTTTTTSTRH